MLWHPGVNEFEVVRTRQLLASARHWYRADTYTLSGANLATLPNRGTGGGAMAVTVGTLAAPTADAQLGGAPSVAFTGTQQMQSNLGASPFTYMHQHGHSFAVYTGRTGDADIFTTRNGLVTPSDTGARCMEWGGLQHCETMNAGATSYLASRSYPSPNISTLLEFAVGGLPYPPGFARSNGVEFGNLTAGAAATSSPELPLTFGNVPGSLPNTNLRMAEFISFSRRLTPYERQLVQDYARTRYGIALPTMTGVDREILKLNPYSWIRADKYVENAGKVSALPDLVLPLHSFAQNTEANQCSTPAGNAAFNGQRVMLWDGDQFYDSNFPAAAWKFTNDGSGMSVHAPLRRASLGDHTLLSAGLATGSPMQMDFNSSGVFRVVNGSTPYPLAGGGPAGIVIVAHTRAGSAASPQLVVRANGLELTEASVPFVDVAPPGPMRLGRRLDGYPFGGEIAESLILDRYPSAQDLATLNAYYLQRYGLTP